MKNFKLIFLFIYSVSLCSQNQGDILFIAFNSDGDKDFSIVTMSSLPANTIVYFTDNEPNVSGDGNSDSEGVLKWVTGDAVIDEGTVIVFSDVDSSSNPNFSCSIGVLTVVDAGFNISSSGDAVYATYGDPSDNSVVTWISGIQNNNNGFESNFEITGLSVSENYVVIDNTASKDGGEYSGVRTGELMDDYKDLILDEENWITHTSDGESLLPFNSESFSLLTLSLETIASESLQFSVVLGTINVNKGSIVKIFNLLGQEVSNFQLSKGLYFVFVDLSGDVQKYKIVL